MVKTARGIRNCNPLNIRHSSVKWAGMSPDQTDTDFVQFVDILHGIRAAFVNLRTHLKQDAQVLKRTTVRKEIARWAPASENNVDAYVAFVCDPFFGLKDSEVLVFSNKNQVCRLLYRMAWYECGRDIPFNLFEQAYEMALR